jgi:hypothetical protein
MAKKRIVTDLNKMPDYESLKKEYADLLRIKNPKGSEAELVEIRKRVEARRWGQQ